MARRAASAAPGGVEDLPWVEAADRAAWRAWLEANHARSAGVWLVYWKLGSGRRSVRYDDVVEECLCFGWIDSKVKRIDAARYRQLITPRKAGGVWSRVNKAKVARLVEAGLMTAAGLARVEAARRDGSWTRLDGAEALEVPDDLDRALGRRGPARRHWDGFAPSARRAILAWIGAAKRADTRARRVAETVRLARLGLRALLDRED